MGKIHPMRPFQAFFSLLCASLLLVGSAAAQTAIRIEPATGGLGWLTRPYEARSVPPVNLVNSPRLESLVRAGNLYLSAPDVVALAIENNLDVEVQRYGPLLAKEVLRRAQAGGALRNIDLPIAPPPQGLSLQSSSSAGAGIGGSSAGGRGTSTGAGAASAGGGASSGAGASSSGGGASSLGEGGSSGSSGGVIMPLGPAIPSFDPTVTALASYQHANTPLSNIILTGTNVLVQNTESYEAQYQQNWSVGLSATLNYESQHTRVNSQFFSPNPFNFGTLDLTLTQNLLQGFGSAVNGRNILVQKNNMKVTDLQFEQQLINTVSGVLNLYWDLVGFNEDLRAHTQEVASAQQLLDLTNREFAIGALTDIEVARAEAQLYQSQQDLAISETGLLQQENVLKNALSRDGVANAVLADIRIIPLDRIDIPAKDELEPQAKLVDQALNHRIEIEQSKINLKSNQLNLVGIKSSLKPNLQAFVDLANNGLAGGYGSLLGQIAERSHPSYAAGFALNLAIRNRAAQSDYAINLLEIRTNELNLQRIVKQVQLDVQNAVIGLQQARTRYDAAVKVRMLLQETLDGDEKKRELGGGTVYQVVQDQRDLATAQSSEVQALAAYSHARISLDVALGKTLEANNVSVEEALAGHISRPSALPADLPPGVRP
jgi:outer membrane protein